jgi:hypothetical protein
VEASLGSSENMVPVADHLKVAIKAQVFALDRFGDIENLPVVQAEMLYDLVHGIQAAHVIALNLKTSEQVSFSKQGKYLRCFGHG